MKKIIFAFTLIIISLYTFGQTCPSCPSNTPGAARNFQACSFSVPCSTYPGAAFTVAIPATFSSTITATNYNGPWNGFSNILSAVNSIGLTPGLFVNYSDSNSIFISYKKLKDSMAFISNNLSSALMLYYTKIQSDSRYLQSFTETDPGVPSVAKTLDTTIYLRKLTASYTYQPKGNYLTISSVSTVGLTGNYYDLIARPSLATVATSGSYNDLSNKPNLHTPDYYNTINISGGAGQAIFYITSDKTSSGAALYSTIDAVLPIINDVTQNYTYGWTYNATTKALTVTAKTNLTAVITLLTVVLGPTNVSNGVPIQLIVKGH